MERAVTLGLLKRLISKRREKLKCGSAGGSSARLRIALSRPIIAHIFCVSFMKRLAHLARRFPLWGHERDLVSAPLVDDRRRKV